MLEFISRHPRLTAMLLSSLFAGLSTGIVCFALHDTRHLLIKISSAMISTAIWAPITCKRIFDRTQTCSYFRAAMLGALTACLALLIVGFPMDAEMRLENMSKGLVSVEQTIKYVLIDNFAANLGCGIFTGLLLGWYLVPLGGLAGLVLREMRKLYQLEPPEYDES